MKKRVWLSLLLAAAMLTGCGGGNAADGSAAEDREVEPVPAAAEAGGSMTATQLEEDLRPLTDVEILSAYDRAVEAYGWFDLTPLPDTGEETVADGVVYRRVSTRRMKDLEDLRTYLRGLFSQELTDRLLDSGGEHPLYREIDGGLYVCAAGRNKDPRKGEVHAEVERQSDSAYFVNVAVDCLDDDGDAVVGLECWSFPYAFQDGRWVFTDFRLVY